MSADNGVYILKTKDQYRVAHLKAFDNVYWSAINGDFSTANKLIPTRVVEMWGNSKYTKDKSKALTIAYKIMDNLPVCEYGINVVKYNKTWKQILKDASKYAKKEIETIKHYGEESFWNMESLQKIADGRF